MGLISGKKPKLGTLDKSKMDWNTFVEQEGIKEELQTHNKGKDGLVNFIFWVEASDVEKNGNKSSGVGVACTNAQSGL